MISLKCLFGHKWSMYRGFNGEPHHTAYCLRPRCEARPYSNLEVRDE